MTYTITIKHILPTASRAVKRTISPISLAQGEVERGRPRADRIADSGLKIKAWLTATGKPLKYLSKENPSLNNEQRRNLPSLSTLKRWIAQDVPKNRIHSLSHFMGLRTELFDEQLPMELFRTQIMSSPEKERHKPMPHTNAVAQNIIDDLKQLVRYNTNTARTVALIASSTSPLTIDNLADRLNISIIQVREIIERLLSIHFVVARSQLGPAEISLSEKALVIAGKILEILDEP